MQKEVRATQNKNIGQHLKRIFFSCNSQNIYQALTKWFSFCSKIKRWAYILTYNSMKIGSEGLFTWACSCSSRTPCNTTSMKQLLLYNVYTKRHYIPQLFCLRPVDCTKRSLTIIEVIFTPQPQIYFEFNMGVLIPKGNFQVLPSMSKGRFKQLEY